MVRYSRPRRFRARRRRAPRRIGYRKMRFFKKLGLGSGILNVKRKLPLGVIYSTGVGGVPQYGDQGLGTLIKLGTAQPSFGLPTGYYDVPFAVTVAFNQQANSGEFTNLFDQYKIKYMKIRFSNNANVSTTQTGGTLPYIEYDTDHDDDTPPGTSIFRERMGIKTKYFTASKGVITLGFVPKPAQAVYQTAITTGYAVPKGGVWINATNDQVPHYGMKGVIRHMWLSGGANQAQITVDAMLHHIVKDIQ